MAEDPRDEDYLDLFKPKPEESSGSAAEVPEPDPGGALSSAESPADTDDAVPVEPVSEETQPSEGVAWDSPSLQAESPDQRPSGPERGEQPEDLVYEAVETGDDTWFAPRISDSGEPAPTVQTLGVVVGAGCLLLMLTAVVVFAFVQVFVRGGGEEEVQETLTPTVFVAATPVPTEEVAEAPRAVPLVSSSDVLVPVSLPERLKIGDTVFTVQAVEAPAGSWPAVPATEDITNWAFGTVVNYILSLAPTPENVDLIGGLERGDPVSLDMSTGIVLNFSVSGLTTGATDEVAYFEQVSPQLTLAVLTEDLAQRTVMTAAYFDDEARVGDELAGAVVSLVGNPVNQGPVRVTVLETYQATGEAAGLPAGTGYLLMDVTIENIGTEVLQPTFFQTFVSDPAGNRYPLTFIAEQFAHYGIPTEPLAPGETVIGSYGYLVTANLEGEYRWIFNPRPASEYWVVVPVPYEVPAILPTPEPTPLAGFAVVTVQSNDVFINKDDGLLDIVLRIENTSAGVVRVTEDDISLNSFTDGELTLVAPAPPLPWMIESGEMKLFQLQFQLPTADSALLTVLGYTFSIENLGGE